MIKRYGCIILDLEKICFVDLKPLNKKKDDIEIFFSADNWCALSGENAKDFLVDYVRNPTKDPEFEIDLSDIFK